MQRNYVRKHDATDDISKGKKNVERFEFLDFVKGHIDTQLCSSGMLLAQAFCVSEVGGFWVVLKTFLPCMFFCLSAFLRLFFGKR